MTSREQLPKNPPLFPLGSYTCKTAVGEFFPNIRFDDRQGESNSAFQKEGEILKTHYPETYDFCLLVPPLIFQIAKDKASAQLGMKFLHGAARIEAQTKKFQLPKVEHDQYIKYAKSIVRLNGAGGNDARFIIEYDQILADFIREEQALQKALPGFLRGMNSFMVGAALMRDFLKTAPTLPSELPH